MNPEKIHDSIMNNIESQFEYILGVDFLKLSRSVEYKKMSEAVWELAHGNLKGEDEE